MTFTDSSRPEHEAANLDVATRYLQALGRGITAAELADFFHEDVVQIEYPNRLTPNGARRDLAAMQAGAERGSQAVSDQQYEILDAVTQGDTVVLEVDWSAILAVALGTLPAGYRMHARFAVFLELRDGRIAAQRNYDCFDPW